MSDAREDAWTSDWVLNKLKGTGLIKSGSKVDDNHIIVVDDNNKSIHVATMSSEIVELDDIRDLLKDPKTEFLVNVSKDSVISGKVLQYGESKRIGIGDYGDLMSALGKHKYRDYINKEADFIINGLLQHSAVINVERINNRAYRIYRQNKPNYTIVALNDYDLTAASVRTGVRKYGRCDAILASNPNCRQSAESGSASTAMDIRILKWAQLLGALNDRSPR